MWIFLANLWNVSAKYGIDICGIHVWILAQLRKIAFLFSNFHTIHLFYSVRELTDVDFKRLLWRPASKKIAPWFIHFPFSSFKLRDYCVCFPLNEDYKVAMHNLHILTSILETSLNFSISNSADPLFLDQILVYVWVFNLISWILLLRLDRSL